MPAAVPVDDVRQRIVEASVLVPPGGAIEGWAALCWLGGRWFDGRDNSGVRRPVTIAVGRGAVRAQPGVRPSSEALDPGLVRWVDGLPITDPRVAVSYEMRHAASDRAAVVAVDMAAYSDLVSLREAGAIVAMQGGWAGVPRARRALAHADENAWSPPEVDLRGTWEDAGYARPLCNAPLFHRVTGSHLGTPDVFDPVAGVAGEYDGDVHLVRRQRDRDLKREGAFRAHSIEIAVMTAPDRHDPSAFVDRLQTAYRHAERHSSEARTWTLEKPSWWTSTETVEQRRALSASQRRRLLAYRAA